MTWVSFQLPEEVHRRARSRASLRGDKLYPYLVRLIAEGVERDEAEARRREREAEGPQQ